MDYRHALMQKNRNMSEREWREYVNKVYPDYLPDNYREEWAIRIIYYDNNSNIGEYQLHIPKKILQI